MDNPIVNFLFDYFIGPLGIIFLVLFCLFLAIEIPRVIYDIATYTPPKTFELLLNDWECTTSHIKQQEECSAKLGCRWTQQTICDNYHRK